MIARSVEIDAIGVEILCYKPGLVNFGSNRLAEALRERQAKGKRVDVVHVHDAAKAVSQLVSLSDGTQALAGRADATVSLIIHSEIVDVEFARGTWPGA